MKFHFLKFLLLLLLIAISSQAFADGAQYKVVSIQDGDSLTATDGNIKFKVRTAAMDAPEKGQPYGKVAKYWLEKILSGKNITITSVGKGIDRYGRVLGHVFVDGKDVALELINEGLATYYRPFCKDYPADPSAKPNLGKDKYNYDPRPYIEAEKVARKLKKNMWSDEYTMLPCKYRRLHK